MSDNKNNDEKKWEKPTATVVAVTKDVQGAVGDLADEDFDGIPS